MSQDTKTPMGTRTVSRERAVVCVQVNRLPDGRWQYGLFSIYGCIETAEGLTMADALATAQERVTEIERGVS